MARRRALLVLSMSAVGLSCRSPTDSAAGLAHSPGAGDLGREVEAHAPTVLVRALHGAVEVLRARAAEWRRLSTGARLSDGDRVRTFQGATAELVFPDGSELRLGEESLIALGDAAGGVLIERGAIDGRLEAGLTIRTAALEARAAGREIGFQ